MTTEIAVSNRLGIALATDSAVTITSGDRVKIFNTADKLFELSNGHPIGVMFNGNMDCLGVPWEILVKNFRDIEGQRSRSTVEEWGRDFLKYVEGHSLVSENIIGGYIDNVISAEVSAVQERVVQLLSRFMMELVDQSTHSFKRQDFDIRETLKQVIGRRKTYLEQFPIAESLEGIELQTLREAYSDKIQQMLDARFQGQNLTEEESEGLTDLVIQSLLRSISSDFAAGVVVAGYGSTETFPALFAAEVDGRVAGKLKVTDVKSHSIPNLEAGGQVIYFAQTDVIERLLKGVDPEFVEKTSAFIERAVIEVAETLEKATRTKRMSKKKIVEREALIRELAETITTEYVTKTAPKLRDGFSREFDRMIAVMPKQELIDLAEALVSVTAVERKATSDEGTVGGPVDVAFITKHEGFVWIKRKHYFARDLNPRYFWRKYGNPP